MTAPDPRVSEIENRLAEVARLQNTRAEHAELDAAVYRSQSDVAYLLAEVRKRDEALARVEDLAKYLDDLAPGDQHYAKLIRAAITPAGGG